MTPLLLGLALFLGIHTIKVWGGPLRQAALTRLGDNGYKGLYTVVALLGFGLILYGYGPAARAHPEPLFVLGVGARHAGTLLTLLGMIGLAAAYVPANHIRRAVRHPMFLGTGLWALGHLLANWSLPEVLLFGGFLAWVAVGYPAAYARDRAASAPASRWSMTVLAVGIGTGVWGVFAFGGLHAWLFGVAPFG